MEELLLRGLLACDKLDIVHQQRVGLTVFLAEFGGRALADGFDNLVGEVIALDIDDVHVGIGAGNLIADGVQQMGFSQTGIAVNKQGIIESCGLGGHSQRSGVGEFVGGAHNKGIEGKLVVIALSLGGGGFLPFVQFVGGAQVNLNAGAKYLSKSFC